MNALIVARLTFKEAVRKRLLVLAAAGGLLFLIIFGVGLSLILDAVQAEASRRPIGGPPPSMFVSGMTVLGFYVVNFLCGMSAIFVSVNTIAGEVDSGTVHSLLARPLSRREFVLGKWLGYAVVSAVYVIGMSVGLLVTVYLVTGSIPPSSPVAVALMVLVAWTLLSLSIIGGTFSSALANGVGLFLLYGLAWLAGLIEAIGGTLGNEAMVYVGIVVSLIIPSDAVWRAASYYLQPISVLIVQSTTVGGFMPFAAATPPAPAMLIYAVLYLIGAVVAAVVIFDWRDL